MVFQNSVGSFLWSNEQMCSFFACSKFFSHLNIMDSGPETAIQCPDTITNSPTKQLPSHTPQGLSCLKPRSRSVIMRSGGKMAHFNMGPPYPRPFGKENFLRFNQLFLSHIPPPSHPWLMKLQASQAIQKQSIPIETFMSLSGTKRRTSYRSFLGKTFAHSQMPKIIFLKLFWYLRTNLANRYTINGDYAQMLTDSSEPWYLMLRCWV